MNMKNGCETCDDFWSTKISKKPYRLAENANEQMLLYQCEQCKSFWIADLRTARIISSEDAHTLFPNFFKNGN